MSADRRKPPAFDPAILNPILDRLACPVCMGRLQPGESRLRCQGCGRLYPIVDGIPVLIAERAAEPEA
jgi:uncharacterized protein